MNRRGLFRLLGLVLLAVAIPARAEQSEITVAQANGLASAAWGNAGKLEAIADQFSEAQIFKYLDGAYETERGWRQMPCVDFDSLDPEQVIIFGGATCRTKRARAWLADRKIDYPWSYA